LTAGSVRKRVASGVKGDLSFGEEGGFRGSVAQTRGAAENDEDNQPSQKMGRNVDRGFQERRFRCS